MEIKDTLKKPCTDKARADFIVENNHNKGYEIRETGTALEALGYTEEEKQEKEELSQLTQESQELENTLKELQSMFTQAQMIGDTETMEEISNTTKELLGLSEETDNGTEE